HHVRGDLVILDKGKPVARRGRKVMGPPWSLWDVRGSPDYRRDERIPSRLGDSFPPWGVQESFRPAPEDPHHAPPCLCSYRWLPSRRRHHRIGPPPAFFELSIYCQRGFRTGFLLLHHCHQLCL